MESFKVLVTVLSLAAIVSAQYSYPKPITTTTTTTTTTTRRPICYPGSTDVRCEQRTTPTTTTRRPTTPPNTYLPPVREIPTTTTYYRPTTTTTTFRPTYTTTTTTIRPTYRTTSTTTTPRPTYRTTTTTTTPKPLSNLYLPPVPTTTTTTTKKPYETEEDVLAEGIQPEKEHVVGDPFTYTWTVKDDPTLNDFNHKAESKDDVVKGEYRTLLPDGRTQVVKYHADWKNGYSADITYEGEPNDPEFKKYKFV